jgi:hypothetical protein
MPFVDMHTLAVKLKTYARGAADTHYMEADERYWVKSRESKYWWLCEDEIEEGLHVEGERKVMAEKGNMVEGKPDYWRELRM